MDEYLGDGEPNEQLNKLINKAAYADSVDGQRADILCADVVHYFVRAVNKWEKDGLKLAVVNANQTFVKPLVFNKDKGPFDAQHCKHRLLASPQLVLERLMSDNNVRQEVLAVTHTAVTRADDGETSYTFVPQNGLDRLQKVIRCLKLLGYDVQQLNLTDVLISW